MGSDATDCLDKVSGPASSERLVLARMAEEELRVTPLDQGTRG